MQGSSITPADRQRRLDAILERHGKARTELVQILRQAQEPEGWIRPEAITSIARALKLPRARVVIGGLRSGWKTASRAPA